MPAPGGAATAARPVRRSKHWLATGAALLALWLGLTAPSVSPVAGPAAPGPPVTTTAVVQDVGGAIGDGGRDAGRRR
jgi:hypothetical protein